LLHVVDISHPNFEDQVDVVNQTLADIGAANKNVLMVFNKIDAYSYVEKPEDDLTPAGPENISLDELKRSWLAKSSNACVFISAAKSINIAELRTKLSALVLERHNRFYPQSS
jgi:GTPase